MIDLSILVPSVAMAIDRAPDGRKVEIDRDVVTGFRLRGML
jgi:hypothetical protein